jgi:hypothetical protein
VHETVWTCLQLLKRVAAEKMLVIAASYSAWTLLGLVFSSFCSGQQQGENKHLNAKTQGRKDTKQFSAPLSLCVFALSLYYLVDHYSF